jgi:hypothetical protein
MTNQTLNKVSERMSFFDYLYVVVIIIYAGRANVFVESGSFMDNPVGASLLIVLSGILALRWNIKFNKQYYLLIFGLFIYFIAVTIKYGEIRPTIFLSHFFLFSIVYIAVKSLKVNFFIIFEQVLFYLAIIGLFFWVIQILLGGDTLYSYFNKIPSLYTFSYVTGDGLNVILYSVQPTSMSLQYDFLPPRNCGFAWEPGAFAVYLCLAIFINLFVIKSDARSNKRLWVFVIALISTQSTTGYIISLVILFYYYLNKNLNIMVLLLPLIVIIIITIFSLPFMSEKILFVYEQVSEIETMVVSSIDLGASYAPGRFASFVIAFEDFINNPVLGMATVSQESWTYKIGANISPISGIGNLLAQYGIVGFFFFMLFTIKSSLWFAKQFNYKGKLLLFFLMLLISVSYSVILLPLIMSFWMYQLFEYQPFIRNIKDKVSINAGNKPVIS